MMVFQVLMKMYILSMGMHNCTMATSLAHFSYINLTIQAYMLALSHLLMITLWTSKIMVYLLCSIFKPKKSRPDMTLIGEISLKCFMPKELESRRICLLTILMKKITQY